MEQRSLVLILARDLADKLASAMFIVDRDGRLVYFNERAESILGQSFADAGRMAMDDWAQAYLPSEPGAAALNPDELPLVVALREKQPSHRAFRIRAVDGEERHIAVTAFPLFSRPDECVGAAAIFWEHGG